MLARMALLIGFCTLLGACYPTPTMAPIAVAPATSVVPPAEKSAAAAVVIEKTGKDQELLAKQVAVGVYTKLVEATRQGKVSQVQYAKVQKLYDAVVNALHAYSVLSPLGEKHADDARVGVAKALAEFLAQAQVLKVL